MTLPPEAVEQCKLALTEAVLPAAAVAAAVFGLLLAALGRRAGFAAAGLAVVAGFAAGNHFREAVPWVPVRNRIEWLPAAVLAAALGGLLARKLPSLGWAVWAAAVAFAVVRVVPVEYHQTPWLAVPALVLAAAVVVAIPAEAARRNPGPAVPLAIAAAANAAAVVSIHAFYTAAADVATIFGAAAFGVAVVAAVVKVDAGGVAAAAGLFLPAVLLLAYHYRATEKPVPVAAFALAAAAPLGTAVGLLPRPAGWKRSLLVVAVPALLSAAAVGVAAVYAPYEFPKPAEW